MNRKFFMTVILLSAFLINVNAQTTKDLAANNYPVEIPKSGNKSRPVLLAENSIDNSTDTVSKTKQLAENSIVFDRNVHDFGTIKVNEGKVSTVFNFVNQGDKPLVIQKVQASCGCTSPEWTKEPVLPGEKGYITAIYNSSSPTAFDKTLTVDTNGNPSKIVLHIKGTVIN